MQTEMNNRPLVSVVMPMHNNAKFVLESIDSVLSQTYSNFELLVVDDGSSDGSFDLVSKIADPRIKLFRNEKSLGAAGARNVALRNAKGKYVAFLDADDLWKPKKLETVISIMEREGSSFVFSDYDVASEDLTPLYTVLGPDSIDRRKMIRCCYIGCLTVVYNREVVGTIQVDERLKKRNDYAMWLLAIGKTGVCHRIPDSLAIYRKNQNGISKKKGKLIFWHYRLFRWVMHFGPLKAWFHALVNVFFYFLKRKKYIAKQ